MIYLNLTTAIIRSPEYVGAEPTERATWLNLLTHCVEQENAGRLVGARQWKDRQWQQTCGVTLTETQAKTRLWTWDGDDLVVAFYPIEKETQVKTKRTAGRTGGTQTTQAKTQAAKTNGRKGGRPPKNPSEPEKPKQNPSINPTEEKIREEKRKEEKEKEERASAPAVAGVSVPDLVALYPRREGLANAAEALARHLANGADPLAVATGTRAHAAVIRTLPGGHLNKFVKSAERFFAGRHWEDDPQTILRTAGTQDGSPTLPLDLGGRSAARTVKIS
jgi:hypothetical protein